MIPSRPLLTQSGTTRSAHVPGTGYRLVISIDLIGLVDIIVVDDKKKEKK